MASTRSMKKTRLSARRSYRKTAKASPCKGKGAYACALLKPKCKLSKGKKRTFCRKVKNTSRKKK